MSRTLTRRLFLLCPFAALGVVPSARAAAPSPSGQALTEWLEGLAAGSQAISEGDGAAAEVSAREALAARPAAAGNAAIELLLGLGLRQLGRFAEGAAALERAAPGLAEPALSEVARFERGQCLFYAGDPAAAAATFSEVAATATGPVAARARWREADALLQAGAPAVAARAYRELLAREAGGPASPGGRLGLAAALRAAGDEAQAIAAYRALWIDEPADPAGRAAGRALRAWRSAGGPVPDPTADERLAHAARLLELAHPRRALVALDLLEATSPPRAAADQGRLLRALALLQLSRHRQAEELARPLAGDPAVAESVRAGAALVRARAAARAGRLEEAVRLYRGLAGLKITGIPGLPAARAREVPEEAAYLAAWLFLDAGDHARAVRELRAYLRAHPRARRADDARWFEAWALHKLGRKGEARAAFARLERGPLAPAALYWQARLAPAGERLGLYRRALREAPAGSWYALLSASRLAAAGEPPPPLAAAPATPIPDGPGSTPARRVLERAAHLLGAGLAPDALAELRALVQSGHAGTVADVVAQLAEAAGDAELPFRMARDHLAPTRRALRWAHPLAFPALLPAAAAAAPSDLYGYLALLRRESAFRPDARSPAGAVGLVQLIPPTAERLALVHGLAPEGARALADPAVSLPLGAAYLALLTERFVEPAVVLAAYNGGPGPAAAWARARAGAPLDAWVEDIPYRETRRYVKNVAADAVVYRALWGAGTLTLDGNRSIPAPRDGVGF